MPTSPENSPPTLDDVAAALGMHRSTVSLGLSGKGTVSAKTRERIAKVAREMGYQPNPFAQRLAKSGNNRLVYLCSGGLDLGSGTHKILTIQWELRRLGWEVPIFTLAGFGEKGQDQASEMRHLCRQRPRAIVYWTKGDNAAVFDELERYQQSGGILVCYDLPVPVKCDQVVFDRQRSAYQAARYLIERGHRKLGIGFPQTRRDMDGAVNVTQNHRLIGFRRALHEVGLELRDDWVFEQGAYEKGGAEMAQCFLALAERPTGLCIVNDSMALAFMAEALEAGVAIPRDVSIIGQENHPVAAYCPVPMTSVTHPTAEIVRAVVELLTERLNGSRQPPRTVAIRGEIVERRSVAAPK